MANEAARLNGCPLPLTKRSPVRWGSGAHGWLAFRPTSVLRRERRALADPEVVAAIAVLKRLAIRHAADKDYSARCLRLAQRIADRRKLDPAEVAKIPVATGAQLAMFSASAAATC